MNIFVWLNSKNSTVPLPAGSGRDCVQLQYNFDPNTIHDFLVVDDHEVVSTLRPADCTEKCDYVCQGI